jgi:TM2 domain-containing membrane protein YozV
MAGQPSITPYDPRDHAPHLRATDTDRESVASLVRSALGDGRIRLDELDERLGAVYGAKTHGDLSAVIDDIVPRTPPPMMVPRPVAPVPDYATSDRTILPGFLLCFFLGVFGAHRFYAGKIGSGVAMLVVTLTFFGLIVTGIWALVDLIILGVGAFRDGDGAPMRRWT